MAKAAIEALRRDYEAMSDRAWDRVFSDVGPDFEFVPPDRGPAMTRVHGVDSARRFVADFFEPFEEVSVVPEAFFEGGDRIVVFFHQRCRPRGSSRMVELRAGHLWTLRDGRPIRLEVFPERERALATAGLSERNASA